MIDSKHEMAAPREETLTLWEWAWRRCKETQPHPPCLPGPTKEKPQQHNQTLHHKKKATNYQPKLQQACTCKLTVPSTVMRTSPWEIGWDNSTTILPCTSSCKKHTHKKRHTLRLIRHQIERESTESETRQDGRFEEEGGEYRWSVYAARSVELDLDRHRGFENRRRPGFFPGGARPVSGGNEFASEC